MVISYYYDQLYIVFDRWFNTIGQFKSIGLLSYLQVSAYTTMVMCITSQSIGHKNIVSQDRWSLVTGSIAVKCGTFGQYYLAFQDLMMAVVYCTRSYTHTHTRISR